uniref:Reverse transcriptase Ty1/copia-type domain-containing protein n=2 Tax=Nicotiana TaxID=4085 RepID=A0A1S4BJY0_TOBAC|nr:PREDICTED: uncharacterized protein LOC104226557 [Nicotiana sylvestris]XP_016489191.1 PREDICTED: uncharacterized protein LOC107809112 [Nicotiana tabacum]
MSPISPSNTPSFSESQTHTEHLHLPTSPPATQPHSSTIEPLGQRRSSRELRLPSHLSDYVCNLPNLKCNSIFSLHALFSQNNHIAPDDLHPNSQHVVRNICHDREPTSYEEAAMYPAWQSAMTQEFEALYANNTWDLVPLSKEKQAIGCRWVYKVQHKEDGSIERYKARLIVKGYTQQVGIDYTETFSHVVKMTTVRRLVGKLNFLTNTRLDIAYGVQHLSQFMQEPREPHLHATYHMLRYLKKDPTLGLDFSNASDLSITAYCYSDWVACPDSRRSVSGYIVLLGGSPVSWKSKKQETISLSSAETRVQST